MAKKRKGKWFPFWAILGMLVINFGYAGWGHGFSLFLVPALLIIYLLGGFKESTWIDSEDDPLE